MTRHLQPQELSAYVDGEVSNASSERLQQHLAECPTCQVELEQIASVRWATRRLPHSADPDGDLWPSIQARLNTLGEGYRTGASWPRGEFAKRQQAVLVAASVLVVLLVGVLGRHGIRYRMGDGELLPNQRVQHLLQQPRLWDRLAGIRLAGEFDNLDRETIAALLDVLRDDENNNARLAAVAVIRRHADGPEVLEALGNAILPQESPVVQMEVLGEIVEMRPIDGPQALRTKLQDDSLQPVVREAIESALRELGS